LAQDARPGLHRDRRIADGHALRCLGEKPDPRDLMRPFPADLTRMWPVSARVNKPESNDPSIVERI
jgi:putative SOS response-associated peptidase YedK